MICATVIGKYRKKPRQRNAANVAEQKKENCQDGSESSRERKYRAIKL